MQESRKSSRQELFPIWRAMNVSFTYFSKINILQNICNNKVQIQQKHESRLVYTFFLCLFTFTIKISRSPPVYFVIWKVINNIWNKWRYLRDYARKKKSSRQKLFLLTRSIKSFFHIFLNEYFTKYLQYNS